MSYTSETCQNSSGGWNYYNDGKKWLFKMVQKKKTIFWADITEDTFRISFWFSDKAEPLIDKSDLPQKLIDEFKTSKRYGAIRAVTVNVLEPSDIESVKKLMEIKLRIK